MMNEKVMAAADHAVEMLEPALVTLMGIFGDNEQQGSVRVTAAKAVLDYGLKLADRADPEYAALAKLDALLDEFRGRVGSSDLRYSRWCCGARIH